jgi:hypothetical protein
MPHMIPNAGTVVFISGAHILSDFGQYIGLGPNLADEIALGIEVISYFWSPASRKLRS